MDVTAGPLQGGNASFAYDPLDNLRVADQGTRQLRHVYDASNRLAELRDPGNALLASLGHDARGNQTAKGPQAYTFDRANRLLATNAGNSSYAYDGLGRRVQAVAGGFTSRFFYSQAGQSLYTQEGKTSQFHNQVYFAGSLVARRSVPVSGGAALVTYQHTDALGSPVAETDAAGALVRRERMTAYGEPADGTWSDGPGFTGHQMDEVSGLIYMQQRYYDPVVGRFLSIDLVAANQNTGAMFNRYLYAAGNPYRYTDPDGRCPKDAKVTECVQSTVSVGGEDVVMSRRDDEFASSNALIRRVESNGSVNEGFSAVVENDSGELHTRPLTNVARSQSIAGEKTSGDRPAGTRFVAHGHKSDSQLDQERGLGDSRTPLKNRIPNVAVSGDRSKRIGVREISGGRLQHRMIRGLMSEKEALEIQRRMDAAAREYLDSQP